MDGPNRPHKRRKGSPHGLMGGGGQAFQNEFKRNPPAPPDPIRAIQTQTQIPHRITDLRGHRFASLVVTRYSGRAPCPSSPQRRPRPLWLCTCDCGGTIEVTSVQLKNRKVRSCGCKKNKPDEVLGAFGSLYREYRRNAKTRSLPFSITKPEFLSLATGPCFYCGTPPQTRRSWARPGRSIDANGLDRIDNTRGYDLQNLVSACKQCNYAKNNLELTEFITWVIRISKNVNRLKPLINPRRTLIDILRAKESL